MDEIAADDRELGLQPVHVLDRPFGILRLLLGLHESELRVGHLDEEERAVPSPFLFAGQVRKDVIFRPGDDGVLKRRQQGDRQGERAHPYL